MLIYVNIFFAWFSVLSFVIYNHSKGKTVPLNSEFIRMKNSTHNQVIVGVQKKWLKYVILAQLTSVIGFIIVNLSTKLQPLWGQTKVTSFSNNGSLKEKHDGNGNGNVAKQKI